MFSKLILIVLLSLSWFGENLFGQTFHEVTTPDELKQAIQNATPGDEIIMANGVWENIEIRFAANGTERKPITLRAETPGQVTIEGESCLKLGGEYLVVDGLYFKNGYTPCGTVIDFKIDNELIANHCKVINCVIEDFTQPNRYTADLWIEFSGKYNQLAHCYIAGKFNQGPTLRVDLKGNQHIRNYHQITNNYFGPRPRKGGARAETIQIGSSYMSMAPAYVNIANNFFERCNGEVEVISSKSNFNEFRNNVFYKCEGSLVVRHGNYCIIDGNFFIGDENSQFNGGVRVINAGHWVTNNYFYRIKGDEFRAPLAIMNGIPRSPLNRYHQVTDAVVAYNTWIDCKLPWQISVGANLGKKGILPDSEIRSERPIRTVLANNIIYNHAENSNPIKAYDKIDGITFKNNLVGNQSNDYTEYKGIKAAGLKMEKLSDWLYVPSGISEDLFSVYSGYGFEDIQEDVFGNSRVKKNAIGAISDLSNVKTNFDMSQYGPSWFSLKIDKMPPKTVAVSPEDDLFDKIELAKEGDILQLAEGNYNIKSPLVIDKKITVKSKNSSKNTRINYTGSNDTPLFQMHPKGHLKLDGILLTGATDQYAFAPLENNMSFGYNLFVSNSQIKDFKNIVIAYKGSFADTISFSNTKMESCMNGLELAAETQANGDYNAEFVIIRDCEFEDIRKNVIHFYRGGYDESTIGGVLSVHASKFTNCGNTEDGDILIKTQGIINVDISKNTFQNNPIKFVAVLWGEKNNRQSENKIVRSGEILVEQYLKQKLLY